MSDTVIGRLRAGVGQHVPITWPIDRAQSHKRRLLRLGQPIDSRDVEPFVGPSRAQCAYRFSTLDIPQLDATILAGADKGCAIRACAEGANPSLLSLPGMQTDSAGYIPPAEVSRHAAAEQ